MALTRGSEHAAIVVGRIDQGEADRIVRLLTPDLGLVAVWARGARRGRSPFAGLDLGVRARVQLRAGRGDLRGLIAAEVEDPRLRLRGSFVRAATAAYAGELCAALAGEGHAEPRLYGLLETALLLLDAAESDPAPGFLAGLEAKALTFAGVNPTLDRCVACARGFTARMAFVATAGGVFHPDDVPADAVGACTVDAELLAALEAARRRPLRESLDTTLPPGPDLLGEVLLAHLRRQLPSRAVLAALVGVR